MPSEPHPVSYLITGPTDAGRTATARLLAERFERGVLLDGAFFERSIVTGRPGTATGLPLRHRLTASVADGYVEAGFTVVIDDQVAPDRLGEFRTLIRSRPCHVIVLLPSGTRDRDQLDDAFAREPTPVGLWLDTTAQSPAETVDVILAKTTSRRSPIVVAAYDPAWPGLFAGFAAPVARAVEDLGATVEHVGSTSVPGLTAKPIIDLDVVVPTPAEVPAAIERLRGLGYVYQGNKGIPGRDAFLWPPGARPHHLYVVVAGSGQHRDRTDFRDRLRRDPAAVEAYGALKRTLALEHPYDPAGYTEAKTEFVHSVLAAARTGQQMSGTEG